VQAQVDRLIRAACSGMVHWKVLWCAKRPLLLFQGLRASTS